MVYALIICLFVAMLLIAYWVGVALSHKLPVGCPVRSPFEVLRASILTNFDQWKFKNRSADQHDYKIHWQVTHEETGIALCVFWGGRASHFENMVGFYKDSAVKLALSQEEQNSLYTAIQTAMAKQLERKMSPRQIDYKDGFFYCPYCGENVDARVVREEEFGQ